MCVGWNCNQFSRRFFGVDEEEVPEFNKEEDDPDFIPEEGLMTKEAAESAASPGLAPVRVSGQNAKQLQLLLVAPVSARPVSLLKQGSASSRMPLFSTHPVKAIICIQVSQVNIFRKGRVAYTPDPQFTCVITLGLKSPGATRFPSVTQFVRIKCKCLHTSGSFTWASASHARLVTTSGGQLTNGKNT